MFTAVFHCDESVDLADFVFTSGIVGRCLCIEQRAQPLALRPDPAGFCRDEERRNSWNHP